MASEAISGMRNSNRYRWLSIDAGGAQGARWLQRASGDGVELSLDLETPTERDCALSNHAVSAVRCCALLGSQRVTFFESARRRCHTLAPCETKKCLPAFFHRPSSTARHALIVTPMLLAHWRPGTLYSSSCCSLLQAPGLCRALALVLYTILYGTR